MPYHYRRKNRKVFWIKYYRDGKCYRESLHTRDEKIAKYLTQKKEIELAEGKSPLPKTRTKLSDIAQHYFEVSKGWKGKLTCDDDYYKINEFLKWLKISYPQQITSDIIQQFLNHKLFDDKVKPITANNYLKVIKKLLNWCIENNYIAENPAKKVKRVPEEKNFPFFLTKEQVQAILEKSKEFGLYQVVATTLYTGMRKGEILALEWKNIDFKNNSITITNKPTFKTKFQKSRTIPLHDDLKNILKMSSKKDGLCFNGVNFKHKFEDFQNAVNIDKFNFHSMRHTFASHMIMCGADLATIKELLGHSNIATTMIYAHLFREHLNNAVKKLNY